MSAFISIDIVTGLELIIGPIGSWCSSYCVSHNHTGDGFCSQNRAVRYFRIRCYVVIARGTDPKKLLNSSPRLATVDLA